MFVAVVAATLELGIGPNTAIFTLVKSTLWQAAPIDQPDRLVSIWTRDLRDSSGRPFPSSCPDMLDWRQQDGVFSGLGYFRPRRRFNVSGLDAEPQRVLGERMSSSLLPLLRVQPGARRVVLLTHGFWMQRFGGDPEIVGLLPADFHVESPAPSCGSPSPKKGRWSRTGARSLGSASSLAWIPP